MEPADDALTLRLLRYLGGEANAAEVAALDALLLEDKAARGALLDLAWQAQTLRELTAEAPAAARRFPFRALAAAAAGLALLAVFLRPDPAPPLALPAAPMPRVDWSRCFAREVSWNDVYPSVLLYPDYVWNRFLHETDTNFPSLGDDYPLLARSALSFETRAFDHIRVIPLSESPSPFEAGKWPAL